ncbi:MAG: PhoX family phosphatase [Hormoscilla sp. SP12CHS1]|nr:PhoX family phosphatase [Hormoscilla sp. SP12CHS1]
MSKLTRRELLIFFGCGAAAAVVADGGLERKILGTGGNIAQAIEGDLSFTSVRLPHPLEIYQDKESFLPTGIDGAGETLPAVADPSLDSYNVIDDVVVPPEYERYVIVKWGDRVFPNPEDYVGYNCDFTSYIPIRGSNNNGFLWVNHEYVSYPMSILLVEEPEEYAGLPTTDELVLGQDLSQVNPATLGEFMYNQGGSILRVRRNAAGRFQVVSEGRFNRRIHGLSGLLINSQRTDRYRRVISWGERRGDRNFLVGTGPAATEVFKQVNSDGLGNRIIGTAFNCSGGTTPWGTILTAEENFQGAVNEDVKPDGSQVGYREESIGEVFGLVGEKYGWMVEIPVLRPRQRARKHTALGRFRHENIAFRIEAGEKLIAYMGDDRRGGHTWKFVSNGVVRDPSDPNNSRLLEDGILYCARLNANGTGTWIPLLLNNPTNPNVPSQIASRELAALGEAQRDGRVRLPMRDGIAGQTEDGGPLIVDLTNEDTALPDYRGKRLRDFYDSQGALLVDAFLAANLVGATPTARPEDLEVHPTTKEVFIAYTDNTPGGDGYPDSRIFQVGKFSAAVNATQQSGGLYKIMENSADGTGNSFRWKRFLQGGEAGAVLGAGFANVDNLGFDNFDNVWGVTDMSTSRHNGFRTGVDPEERMIDHSETGDVNELVGVFGNNWLFYIPTSGQDAGAVIPFAYGPVRCEMTGPTFVGDTLILAVQHPGESVPIGDGTQLNRDIEMLNLNGRVFNQTRTVPRGSNWPSNIEGDADGPPLPTVIGIKRKDSAGGDSFL